MPTAPDERLTEATASKSLGSNADLDRVMSFSETRTP